ncbi:hypothetical protein GCM10009839_47050 [Catenulispora yoronensis]|uniref:Uncharacterized protein n=1 Tax=Catenulispora yoronensis TaxID=450799 RepID=A0ABN2UN83_9ACTN
MLKTVRTAARAAMADTRWSQAISGRGEVGVDAVLVDAVFGRAADRPGAEDEAAEAEAAEAEAEEADGVEEGRASMSQFGARRTFGLPEVGRNAPPARTCFPTRRWFTMDMLRELAGDCVKPGIEVCLYPRIEMGRSRGRKVRGPV